MLSSSLRRNACHSSLQNFQKCLLYTFTGNITGDGYILRLTCDLIDLIDINNSVLRTVSIIVSSLDKIIEGRQDTKAIGFGAEVASKEEQNVGELFKQVMPEDLIRYGLIPEFVGRVPVVVTLDGLDENALLRILQEPKNALTKQYHKLFELDGVELDFEDEALRVMARKSMERKTGARGLRAIMESTLMDLMYKTPSDDTIRKCIITKEAVEGTGEPQIVHGEPLVQQAGASNTG